MSLRAQRSDRGASQGHWTKVQFMQSTGAVILVIDLMKPPSYITHVLFSSRAAAVGLALLAAPLTARASFLQGEALDNLADWIAIAVLIIAPIVLITVFWLVHILPEKIAEKKHHPQAKAIQTL